MEWKYSNLLHKGALKEKNENYSAAIPEKRRASFWWVGKKNCSNKKKNLGPRMYNSVSKGAIFDNDANF